MDSPQRKRGRPRSAEPIIPISTRVRTHEFDTLQRLASERRVSMSGMVRLLIVQAVSRTIIRNE